MSISKIDKPWGYEELLELNSKYVVKRLFMKKDHQCSLQYHNEKHETIYVITGILKIIIGETLETLTEKIYYPNDIVSISPKIIHRMYGESDCIYLESSTPELNDVVRLVDDYARV